MPAPTNPRADQPDSSPPTESQPDATGNAGDLESGIGASSAQPGTTALPLVSIQPWSAAADSAEQAPAATDRSKATDKGKGRYAFVSLGCPKNLVDSERMLGLLQIDGYELVNEADGADFVIVNTCGFIEEARQESLAVIDEMLDLKQAGRTKGVIVSGCLAERQGTELLSERPDIDSLVGVFGREEVGRVADRLVGNLAEQRAVFRPAPVRPLPDQNRLRITPRHFAYLKISEGCDRLCTFCAIPKMRGKHASKPQDEILQEARQLADDGVRELIVVAQDTTYYGIDQHGEPRLAELLQELDKIPGLDWIRLMYFYPMYISDRLLQTIAESSRIIPYLDMPLQHINDKMLQRMSRRVTRSQTEDLLARMREVIPGLTMRTTFITGFPGETDEEFAELVDFVAEQKFERLGVFTYSYEPDTPAARLPNQLPEQVKQQRREDLMAVQQPLVFARNEQQLGRTCDILIDSPVANEDDAWIGRTHADAPDVDCLVFVTGAGQSLKPGDLVSCEIVGAQDYDLIAVAIDEPR